MEGGCHGIWQGSIDMMGSWKSFEKDFGNFC